MEITTLTCPECGTIVAENVLAKERVMNCPYYECEEILSFEDLQQQADSQEKSHSQ
jgi:ssDNA-binding Zn-finger/Zn-ribbon topoisomerase 1